MGSRSKLFQLFNSSEIGVSFSSEVFACLHLSVLAHQQQEQARREHSVPRISIVLMAEDSSWEKQMNQTALALFGPRYRDNGASFGVQYGFAQHTLTLRNPLTCLKTASNGTSQHSPCTSCPAAAVLLLHPWLRTADIPAQPLLWTGDLICLLFCTLVKHLPFSTSPFLGYKTEESTGRFRTDRGNVKLQN